MYNYMDKANSFKNLDYVYDYFGSTTPPFESLIGYNPAAQLGIGGHGATILYQSNKNKHAKKVVKIITPHSKSSYDREVVILKALSNKGRCTKNNIACFGEIIKFPELYFYSMEYIPGKPLWDYLNYMKLSITSSIGWGNYLLTMKKMFLSLCKSLNYVHMMGVIHNDIKGNNIIIKNIKGVDTPILIDFGLSETRDDKGRVAIYKYENRPWHPMQAEYYSGFFSDATLIDFYSLKRTFFLPETPSYNMLLGIPEEYSNDEIYKLTFTKKIMTSADWKEFFVLLSDLSKKYKTSTVRSTKTKIVPEDIVKSFLKPRQSTLGKK